MIHGVGSVLVGQGDEPATGQGLVEAGALHGRDDVFPLAGTDGHPGQVPDEHHQFLVTESGEHGAQGVLEGPSRALHPYPPLVGETQATGAPVPGAGGPDHEPVADQTVDEPRGRADRGVLTPGDVLDPGATVGRRRVDLLQDEVTRQGGRVRGSPEVLLEPVPQRHLRVQERFEEGSVVAGGYCCFLHPRNITCN